MMPRLQDFDVMQWIIVGAAISLVGWVWWWGGGLFPMDDAYIVAHAVEALHRGAEWRYPDGGVLDGVTSPVHVFLIYLLSFAFSVATSQMLVIGGAVVFYLLGLYRLSLICGCSQFFAAVLAIVGLLVGHTFYQLFNGLETGLAMAVVTWSLVLFYRPIPERLWLFVLLGAMPFVRPELVALSSILFLRALVSLRGRQDGNSVLLCILMWGALGGLPWFALLFWFTGSPIPNTVSAKLYFFAEGCAPFLAKLQYISGALSNIVMLGGLLLIGGVMLLFHRLRFVVLVFVILFLLSYTLRFPGALYHNWYRYIHLFAPFVVFGWAIWLAAESRRLRGAGAVMLAVAVGLSLSGFQRVLWGYGEGIRITQDELGGVADWVAEHVPASSVVLVHDAGFISSRGEQPLVDVVGLKTASSVDVHRYTTWGMCARYAGAISHIAERSKAEYFVVLNDWDRSFGLTESLRITGWRVRRMDSDRGDSMYKVYQIVKAGNQ